MHYLVTGGAGFMGIDLVRPLLAQGDRVRSRDIAPFDHPEAGRIEVIRGDIRDRSLHAAAFQGIDVVVHCAAALPLARPAEIASTNVEGSRLLLDSAAAAGVGRFVFVSSTAVCGIPDHHPLLEHDPLEGVGPYGASKIAAEALCAAARARGMCVPILRPKSFVGPERLGVFELLYEFAAEGRNFPVLGAGANLYQLLDVEDLCRAVRLTATAEAGLVDDTFNVGAERFGPLRESFQAVLDRAGHGRRVVSLPAKPALWTLRLLERLRLSPLYGWIYDTMTRDSYVCIERLRDRLGFVPRYSSIEALLRNYDWYLANRDRIAATTGTTHRVHWKKGTLSVARFLF